jgi:transcriptional regulator with XRE-family HTH domain
MIEIYVGACAGSGHMGNFGDWVKLKRKEQGITLKELDALTGVSYGAISDWERGRRTPHRDTAVRVAEALRSDPREALEALMADTPGLDPLPEIERIPDEDEILAGIQAYTGDNPTIMAAKAFQMALEAAKARGNVTGEEPEDELVYGRGSAKGITKVDGKK